MLMNIEPTIPTTKNPPQQFAGDAWLDAIALPHEADQRMVVATVRFAPGARTAAASISASSAASDVSAPVTESTRC